MQLQSLLPADSLYGLPTAPRSLNRNFHDPFLHQCLLMVGFGLDLESDGSSVSPPAAHCQRQNPQNRHSISGSLPGSSAPGQPKGFRLKSVPAPLPPQSRRAGRPDGMKRSETDLRDFPLAPESKGLTWARKRPPAPDSGRCTALGPARPPSPPRSCRRQAPPPGGRAGRRAPPPSSGRWRPWSRCG